jgi:hypothetical protein
VIPHDQNHNPNARYSNKKLHAYAVTHAVVTSLAFGIGSAVIHVFASGNPIGYLSVAFFILGCGAGLAVFFPSHFRHARNKRAQFLSAGGDPTGMTLFMFGAMGGHLTKEGGWEWYRPGGSGGDGSSAI